MAFLTWASFCCLFASVAAGGHYAPYLYEPNCEDCSASKSYPCAHSLTQMLIEKALIYLAKTSDNATVAWHKITTDIGANKNGFYIFAYEYAGPCVSHGANSAFVGKTLPEIVAMVNNPTDGQVVDDTLQLGADAGGGHTVYDWTNKAGEPPMQKISYTVKLSKWGKDYYLGSGYNDIADTLVEACVSSTAAPCAEKNVLILMGDVMSKLYGANEPGTMNIFDMISAKSPDFRTDNGFYVFAYKFSGECVAHGANSKFVGMTLPEIVDFINNPSNGQKIDDALQAGAEAGGSWVEYDWKNNADEPPYKKIAYVMKFIKFGVEYYAGVGYNNVCTSDNYMMMKTCTDGPAPPKTGTAGCEGPSCGEIKSAYRTSGCCGQPMKTFQMPYRRRLQQANMEPSELLQQVEGLLEQVKAQDGAQSASELAKSIGGITKKFATPHSEF